MKALFSRKLLVSIYQCWNCFMNKNCFACMIPSNPKFDKRLRNKSFSNAGLKSRTLQYWFQEKTLQRHHNIPSDSGIEHQVKTSHRWNLNCWKANWCRPSTLAHVCEHGLGLCARWQWDRYELMSNNVPIEKHVAESFGWNQLRIVRRVHAVALGE